jgi:hypothetical protein
MLTQRIDDEEEPEALGFPHPWSAQQVAARNGDGAAAK